MISLKTAVKLKGIVKVLVNYGINPVKVFTELSKEYSDSLD
jgi:hypothetical protein